MSLGTHSAPICCESIHVDLCSRTRFSRFAHKRILIGSMCGSVCGFQVKCQRAASMMKLPIYSIKIYNARGEFTADVGSYSYEQGAKPLTDAAPTTTTTTTSTTTTTMTSTTSTTTTTETTTTTATMTTTTEKKSIATGPPALSVPPMCSFRHTERTKNETCKEAREWREDAIT